MYEYINLMHVAFGSLALAGSLVAFVTVKGSPWHVRGGKLFAWMMGLVVATTFIQMTHELLPLAIVMCLTVIYLVPSALLSVNRSMAQFRRINVALMVLLGLLFTFTMAQFVRFNLNSEEIFVGPAVMATLFGILLFQDWRMMSSPPSHPNAWLRRHLTRMILAFTFAVMALVRIGLNFGLTLEQTVIYPLAAAAIVIAVVYRSYPIGDPETAT